jgi:hypothetical protein
MEVKLEIACELTVRALELNGIAKLPTTFVMLRPAMENAADSGHIIS